MKSLLVLCLAALLSAAQAKEPRPHQHGVAKLQVAVDGKMLELVLESPLANLIGFERRPQNDKERQTVRAMAQRFHDPASLFTPTPQARCTARGAELSSGVIDAALLAATKTVAPAKPVPGPQVASDGHADLDATLRFECENPAALKSIDVGLFEAFAGLRQIDAAVVSAKGQRGARLTPKQTLLNW